MAAPTRWPWLGGGGLFGQGIGLFTIRTGAIFELQADDHHLQDDDFDVGVDVEVDVEVEQMR